MLGMYVHTHWGYHHPYAARTWTLEDWRSYLSGLKALGYDLVMFWPLVDAMPVQPTSSDRAFLAQTAQVIDMAHQQFGMKFWITLCPNVVGNDHAAEYLYQERPYFVCEHKVDPRDPAEVAAMLAARRWQLEPLRGADGLVIIDSDPGGYIGSTNAEFVALLEQQMGIFRQFNPHAEFIYWMLLGWENYNRFWAEAQQSHAATAEPKLHIDIPTFVETLAGIKSHIAEPWSLMAFWPQHMEAIRQVGVTDKGLYFPYGPIEGEPTFPLTNYSPSDITSALAQFPVGAFPRGVMANAQTHCLQLPHTYLFARFARDGVNARIDLPGFANGLIAGQGKKIAAAWEAIGSGSPPDQRRAANVLWKEIGKSHDPGQYSGLLLGDADRFLSDLVLNLEVRASLLEMKQAVDGGQPGEIKQAVREVLTLLRPYQARLGFVDAYGGPLHELLNEPLAKLGDARLDEVLAQFHDWRNPSVRNGVLLRLLQAMEDYIQR